MKDFYTVKTLYTVDVLNTFFINECFRKRVYALAKTLKGICLHYAVGNHYGLNDEEITRMIKRNNSYDNLLCVMLKRIFGVKRKKGSKRVDKVLLRKIESDLNVFRNVFTVNCFNGVQWEQHEDTDIERGMNVLSNVNGNFFNGYIGDYTTNTEQHGIDSNNVNITNTIRNNTDISLVSCL